MVADAKGSPQTKPGRPFGTPSVKLASSLSAFPILRPSLRKGTVRVTAASRETSETSSRDIADSRPLKVKLQSKKLEKHVTTAFSDHHFSKSKNASSGVVSIMAMPDLLRRRANRLCRFVPLRPDGLSASQEFCNLRTVFSNRVAHFMMGQGTESAKKKQQ
jgi:hypothetical protein